MENMILRNLHRVIDEYSAEYGDLYVVKVETLGNTVVIYYNDDDGYLKSVEYNFEED